MSDSSISRPTAPRRFFLLREERFLLGAGAVILVLGLCWGWLGLPAADPGPAAGSTGGRTLESDTASGTATQAAFPGSDGIASLAVAFALVEPKAFVEKGSLTKEDVPASEPGSIGIAYEVPVAKAVASPTKSPGAAITPTVATGSRAMKGEPSAREKERVASGSAPATPPPDLDRLGYKVRGIIHRARGRSSVFILDPTRGREVVVIAGASDPIKLLEISEREILIATPKGRGRLKLPDAEPKTGVTAPAPSAVAPAPQKTAESKVAGKSENTGGPDERRSPPEIFPTKDGENWGARVGRIPPDSPLGQAGLREGDRVVSFGQQPLQSAEDAMRRISDVGKGFSEMVVIRDGKQVTIPGMPPSPGIIPPTPPAQAMPGMSPPSSRPGYSYPSSTPPGYSPPGSRPPGYSAPSPWNSAPTQGYRPNQPPVPQTNDRPPPWVMPPSAQGRFPPAGTGNPSGR